MKEGSDTIYSIPSYSADWATAEVSKFQKSPDAGAGPAKLEMPSMPGMPGMPPGMPGMPHGMGHGPDDGHGH